MEKQIWSWERTNHLRVLPGESIFFYNDNGYPTNAENADVIIIGDTNIPFGRALVAGDFNADGRTDLVASTDAYNTNGGRVYIFYNDGSIPTTVAEADVIISTEAFGEFFGSSLVGGDFNADGTIDLAVGATRHPGGSLIGRVYIFYTDGTNNFGTATCSGTPAACSATNADILITGVSSGDYFGLSLGAGDWNADGKTDLVVGSTAASSGRAYIFYNGSITTESSSGADVMITGESSGNNFSKSFASGDFNADGTIDLAVGAYTWGGGGAGRVYIFYNDGNFGTVACTTDCLAATADERITGVLGNEYVAFSLATGDFNADGKTDLVVGAPNDSSTAPGRAYIFYNGAITTESVTSADVIINGEETYSFFGNSLAIGDFNSDGRTDLAVGARYFSSSNRGKTYIFYSQNGQINTNQNSTGEATGDAFGYAMTAGDWNADGRTDLAVGAYSYDPGGADGTGR
ncbi:MAG TPA: FG-GAP-like repeat-containing protein, partial [Patescibacteria group bacterium]|nr:FG-GAP-like repeat-containing protein [Patescibacteria group bacterium]